MKLVLLISALFVITTHADPSAVDLISDVYSSCLQQFSFSCVKPKAMNWINLVADKPEIKVTENLVLVKKFDAETESEKQERGLNEDIIDKFEDFLQTHDLVAKVPKEFQSESSFGRALPADFQPEDLKVPLAVTGRSKIVKKVIVPFLLGLKFKTAVLVPLALALIALKTWKALTLGLLSIVLTGALLIFKLSKPKVNYEVIHFPQHIDHHVEHIDHPPVAAGWEHAHYGRQLNGQEMAYNAYVNN